MVRPMPVPNRPCCCTWPTLVDPSPFQRSPDCVATTQGSTRSNRKNPSTSRTLPAASGHEPPRHQEGVGSRRRRSGQGRRSPDRWPHTRTTRGSCRASASRPLSSARLWSGPTWPGRPPRQAEPTGASFLQGPAPPLIAPMFSRERAIVCKEPERGRFPPFQPLLAQRLCA